MLTVLGILKMLKSWLIALGVFIVGCFVALLYGRQKQASVDKTKQIETDLKVANNVIEISQSVRSNIAKRPASGPDSAVSELRDNWQAQD